MLIVLDTNIIVSALMTPDGKAFSLLKRVMQGEYIVCLSLEIMEEYKEVLHRERLHLDSHLVDYLLSVFYIHGVWIEPLPSNPQQVLMRDESDRKFFDVAKCMHAKLVTGNFKHYPVDELITSLDEFAF